MSDRRNRLLPEIAEAWELESPPAGFASRVVETWAERNTVQPASRARPPYWIAAAVLAAALLLWLGFPDDQTATGSARPTARATITLANRAVLVAQGSGSVFYRVESGPSFDVVTPYGTVAVQGTCFTVEVDAMFNENKQLKAGLVGAALATAVVVTVYEGQVALADDANSVTVGAGERAVAQPGRVPRLVDNMRPAATPAVVSQSARAQSAAVRRGRADERSRARPGGDDETSDTPNADDAVACAHDSSLSGCSWVDPSDDTLREMARCAVVRVDSPHFLGERDREPRLPPPALMGLSDEQGADLKRSILDYKAQYLRDLAEMYVEAGGGSPESAAELPADALTAVVTRLLDHDAMEDERRHIARERAGLIDPPEDISTLSLAQRWTRHSVGVGDAFERVIADVAGSDVAHSFRLHKDGWPGSKQTYSGACVDIE